MNSKSFLINQLETSANTIKWAISMIPGERLYTTPPHGQHPNTTPKFKVYFGDWPAARLLFHLIHYEEEYAIPALNHWLGGPHPAGEMFAPDGDREEAAWQAVADARLSLNELLDRFMTARVEQIALINRIPDEAWHYEKVNTIRGQVAPSYVVAKTIQHTVEHTNEILRNALYWDRVLTWLDSLDTENSKVMA